MNTSNRPTSYPYTARPHKMQRKRRSAPHHRCLISWLACSLVALSCGDAAVAKSHKNPSTAAAEVTLDVDLGEPVMLASREQRAYLKISLVGFELPAATERPPINLALVLDRSSSMTGDKIEKAKAAALMVLDRLGADDILSVVAYDSTVQVLVPATRITNRAAIRERIRALQPRGATALFAGVSHGIEETGKFLSDQRVNRVILLSDGQANVGPSSPNELGRLGHAAGKQGIAITTIGLGLGYNEDLMTQLAMRSDGNHGFAENADQLAAIFNYELGDVMSVVAQDVDIEIEFEADLRPLRGLNREIEIHGKKAVFSLNQLYSKQEKYVLIEVAVPATRAGTARNLADVAVEYNNMLTGKRHTLNDRVGVRFSASRSDVARSENRDVMVTALEALAVKRNREAVALRDQGKVDEAKKVLIDNARSLRQQGKRYRSKRLDNYGKDNFDDAANLDGKSWNKRRKAMRKNQHSMETNQSY
ncbi:MAG: VWA domain-containing protein [Proteobacteria bacterium]|nr:VWA domain-containing protein [Pseudomonadota bacterium]